MTDVVPQVHPHTRFVAISATYLSRDFKSEDITDRDREDMIFFFGSKRSWVFPANEEEREESLKQPTKYLEFDKTFIDMILDKESKGLCYWLKPDCDFKKVSEFFANIKDPVTGEKICVSSEHNKDGGLILDERWWYDVYNQRMSQFGARAQMVIDNYRDGEHDYNCVMELIAQSQPHLKPVLRFH
ncbi:cadherin [Acrasis kona]|uniref:Cadherin n=1 Tax=Acrasis kona TaxID=1008807 RepID=A0AAW2Z0M5_9EUKA